MYVQESQIELNKVFLNEIPLKKLAEATGGAFYRWDSRRELANFIDQKVQKSVVHKRIVLKQTIGMFFFNDRGINRLDS